jgi:hypothetical protein
MPRTKVEPHSSSSAFSVRRNMNPVSTRIELGCLGLMGTFWIGASSPRFFFSCRFAYRRTALGAFLASSDSETASVECFVSESDLTPIDGGCESFFASPHRDFTLRMRSFDRNLPSTVPSSRSIFTFQCYPECVLFILLPGVRVRWLELVSFHSLGIPALPVWSSPQAPYEWSQRCLAVPSDHL